MKLVSLEPTPNPNSMKLNLDESLPPGKSFTYSEEDKGTCPEFIRKLLDIPGVETVFQMADFVALQRDPRTEWKKILTLAQDVFDGIDGRPAPELPKISVPEPDVGPGEVRVEIQMYRNIPMQVKVTAGTEVVRIALPERFTNTVNKANSTSPNFLKERRWADQGIRYGTPKEVAQEVMEEVSAVHDQERLDQLLEIALRMESGPAPSVPAGNAAVMELPDDPDWRVRYAALEKMEPVPEAIPVFAKALSDPKPSVRRLAAAMLGLTNDPDCLVPLCRALKDVSVSVRRTAGDSLSDLGDPSAMGPMIEALKDESKLVRWRAARFLYESGDESAIPALRESEDDPEFEVKMQVRMAVERIEGGRSARGPVWQQMTQK